jgi:hypothetical protein
MVADRKQPTSDPGAPRRAPEWADGLKQLYDSVVEEELPDSFKDLLARLDDVDPKRGPVQAGNPAQSPDGRGGRP